MNFMHREYLQKIVNETGELNLLTDALAPNDGLRDCYDHFYNICQMGSFDLVIPAGTYLLEYDLTIPEEVNLRFQKNAVIKMADGKTLTIRGNIMAGKYQIFSLDQMVTDGVFADEDNWTLGDGWTIADNKATHTEGTETLSQAIAFIEGQDYLVSFQITGMTAGTITASVNGEDGSEYDADQFASEIITAGASGELIFTPSDDFDGSISDVEIYAYGKYNISDAEIETIYQEWFGFATPKTIDCNDIMSIYVSNCPIWALSIDRDATINVIDDLPNGQKLKLRINGDTEAHVLTLAIGFQDAGEMIIEPNKNVEIESMFLE